MGKEQQPFEFSELVELYCSNVDIVKSIETRWRAEIGELIKRLRTQLSKYDSDWYIVFANTYATIRKKIWGRESALSYEIWYDPERIGKSRLQYVLCVRDKQQREKICESLNDKIAEAFSSIVDSNNSYVTKIDIEVDNKDYEGAIIKAAEKCMAFAPELDPYVI
jgi:hypothetical protein